MENARIGLFEASPGVRAVIRIVFEKHEHAIVMEAGSLEEAREVLASLGPGQMDIAVIDGNFTPGSKDNSEGGELAGLVSEKDEDIVIIGIPDEGIVEGAEYNRSSKDIYELLGFIAGL